MLVIVHLHAVEVDVEIQLFSWKCFPLASFLFSRGKDGFNWIYL